MSAPDIRTAASVDDGALRRFYAEAFPKRAAFLSEHWRWLYRLGRFPGIEPLVLAAGGRVIGHAGAIPLLISRLGRSAPAIWFVDFSILPEFQGRGGGRALTEAWMRMCPDRLTFCNERSIQVFRKFGWRERYDARACSLPISPPGLLRVFGPAGRAVLRVLLSGAPPLRVGPLPAAPEGLSHCLDDAPTATPRIARDEDWTRWRLLEHPRRGEHLLAELEGVGAVLRLFTSLGRLRAHLLHVGPGSPDARARLVAAFSRWALEQGADDAWMATDDAGLLRETGVSHLPRRRRLRFAWHSDDGAVMEALDAGLPTQGLDSDHDLMFPC